MHGKRRRLRNVLFPLAEAIQLLPYGPNDGGYDRHVIDKAHSNEHVGNEVDRQHKVDDGPGYEQQRRPGNALILTQCPRLQQAKKRRQVGLHAPNGSRMIGHVGIRISNQEHDPEPAFQHSFGAVERDPQGAPGIKRGGRRR